MKVVFVCEGFNSRSIIAQPWRHVFEIAKRMRDYGDDCVVLSDQCKGYPQNEVISGVSVRRIKKGTFLFDREELKRNVDEGFDVLNWNSSGFMSASNFLRIEEIRKQLVWTLHSGIIGLSDLKNLKPTDVLLLRKFWNNALYSLCSKIMIDRLKKPHSPRMIVALSERLRDYIVRLGVEASRVCTIYSGIDTDFFSFRSRSHVEDTRSRLGVRENEHIVLYYGPLSPFRGVDELVSAMPMVLSKLPSTRFVFLARTLQHDPRSHALKKLIVNEKRALLLEGVVSQGMLIDYLSTADVVAVPFRFWPYVECPLTVLEAMAAGRPLVTTPIGAIPEIVKDGVTGLVVRPRSTEIGRAIIRLLNDTEFALRLGQNARGYVLKNHSWDHIVQQTRTVFQNLQSDR